MAMRFSVIGGDLETHPCLVSALLTKTGTSWCGFPKRESLPGRTLP